MEKLVFLASDHAGFERKEQVRLALQAENQCKVIDLGPHSADSVDYPDFAEKLCAEMKKFCQDQKKSASTFGILICGSGQGMAIKANRFNWIRAALVYSSEIAALSREHNDANVICLGARFCSSVDANNWVRLFLTTSFAGGRHATRVAKLS